MFARPLVVPLWWYTSVWCCPGTGPIGEPSVSHDRPVSRSAHRFLQEHDEVMIWVGFPHYWPLENYQFRRQSNSPGWPIAWLSEAEILRVRSNWHKLSPSSSPFVIPSPSESNSHRPWFQFYRKNENQQKKEKTWTRCNGPVRIS